jgi:hypothetical protein
MPHTPSLLDPDQFIDYENRQQIKNNLNIAAEIYLAERCASIHYEDLMSGTGPNQVSKDMLISWLNDSIRHGEVLRAGIISRYTMDRPDDFENGEWQPLNFNVLIEFMAKKLTDKDFVGGKGKAQLFASSIRDPSWLHKAAAVTGLKMLERMHRQGVLKSKLAKIKLDLVFNSRELLESSGRIIGRVVKNNGSSRDVACEIKEEFGYLFRQNLALSLQHYEQQEEYRIYIGYRKRIEEAIRAVPSQLHPQLQTNLF